MTLIRVIQGQVRDTDQGDSGRQYVTLNRVSQNVTYCLRDSHWSVSRTASRTNPGQSHVLPPRFTLVNVTYCLLDSLWSVSRTASLTHPG